jgi:hypothetical protein
MNSLRELAGTLGPCRAEVKFKFEFDRMRR